ncbi:hypothetical protein QUB47_04515 [Microcoleus sp. AT9_B5]
MENNQPSLQALLRAIEYSQGQFRLILVSCNYKDLRAQIIQQLRQQCHRKIQELVLDKNIKNLYTTIQEKVQNGQTQALIVSGLESTMNLDAVLTSTNKIREEFNRDFRFPLLVWVNNEVLNKFHRLAADLKDWATTIHFTLTPDELVKLLQHKEWQLFDINSKFNPEERAELEAIGQDLKNAGVRLKPSLKASLELGLGICALKHNQIDIALTHYQESLEFWKQNHNFQRQGILRLNIARCYERQAEEKLAEKKYYLTKARDELQQCLDLFKQAQCPDLVAQHIGKLGEVVRRLQEWSNLQELAEKALKLHQRYDYSRQLAQDYGFLAEVALKKSQWMKAKEFAEKALSINDRNSPNKSLYQFILAKSQSELGQVKEAVSTLENARHESAPQSNPQLYIEILEKLSSLHFDRGEYREAFQLKQDKLTIKHQYGFQPFIGASALPCPVENKG